MDDGSYDGGNEENVVEGDLSRALQALGRSWAGRRLDGWKKENYM